MQTFTSHIADPERLARIAKRDRAAVFQPAPLAEALDRAQLALAHRAWVGDMMAADESHQSAWQAYGRQLAEQNQRQADRKAVADSQRAALAEAEARKRQRQRKDREQAAAFAAAMAGNYHGAIQAEISAILGGGL